MTKDPTTSSNLIDTMVRAVEDAPADGPSAASSPDKYAHHTDSFVNWIGQELVQTNPALASEYPDVFRLAPHCIDRWRNRFHGNPALWNRLFSKDRVCKEIVEAVPIVHRVLQFLQRQEDARRQELNSNKNAQKKEITIVDLCSGKGYLSMLLSEMLAMKQTDHAETDNNIDSTNNKDQKSPSSKSMVTKFILIDKQWPLHDGQPPKSHQINWDHIYGTCPQTQKSYYDTWPIPLITSKQDLKAGRTKALLTERLFQTTDIHDNQIQRTYIVLAVHLCGTLALRAVDMFNDNPSAISWMALKPCCLPPPVFIKQKAVFTIGQHSFDAREVCSGGRWHNNVWKGPPRCTLPPKFQQWTRHLYKGIDLANNHDENKDAYCQQTDAAHKLSTTPDTDEVESDEKGQSPSQDESPQPTPSESINNSLMTPAPGRQGDKRHIEELVQVGGGYQNDFIFAERGTPGKTTLAVNNDVTVAKKGSNETNGDVESSRKDSREHGQVKRGVTGVTLPTALILLMALSCIVVPAAGYATNNPILCGSTQKKGISRSCLGRMYHHHANGSCSPSAVSKRTLPRHVAFICDGNSRWARQRGLPVIAGHAQGAKRLVDDILPALQRGGIEFCTMYGFSTENWKRSDKEIREIFIIMEQTAERMYDSLMSEANQNVRIKILGDLEDDRIPESLRMVLTKLELNTNARIDSSNSDEHRYTLCLGINYGGRQDILNAAKQLARTSTNIDKVSEEEFSSMLYTDGIPDPDLVVRTSGEYRLSNFLLWNAAYAELYFTDTLWPDFDEKELAKSLAWFSERRRRFGARDDSTTEVAVHLYERKDPL